MATNSQFTALEAYLHSSYEPDAEYVDGEIEERPAGEFDHSSRQDAITVWFRQNAKRWNIRVRPELRVQVSVTRFRVPDRNQPVEQIITHPPLGTVTGRHAATPEAKAGRLPLDGHCRDLGHRPAGQYVL